MYNQIYIKKNKILSNETIVKIISKNAQNFAAIIALLKTENSVLFISGENKNFADNAYHVYVHLEAKIK